MTWLSLSGAARPRFPAVRRSFVFNPRLGRNVPGSPSTLRANPSMEKDWYETKFQGVPTSRTAIQWRIGAPRKRRAFRKPSEEDQEKMTPGQVDFRSRACSSEVTQQDVVYRRYLISRSPVLHSRLRRVHKGAGTQGTTWEYRTLSRQLVLFCVERRKAWRMLQSKRQESKTRSIRLSARYWLTWDAGKISRQDLFHACGRIAKGEATERREGSFEGNAATGGSRASRSGQGGLCSTRQRPSQESGE